MKHILACAMLICWCAANFPGTSAAGDTDAYSLPDETRKAGSRLLVETGDFAITPFQLENGNLLLTLGFAGALGLTYGFDGEIRDRLQKNRSRGIDKAADAGALVGDPYLHLGLAALVYVGGILDESPRWKETGEMLGEALILADGATLILKEATGRGRPVVTTRKGNFRPFGFRSDYDGFPSMHTASSFAIAAVLARTSESMPVAVLSYCAAAFVGYSRLNQNKHWASDVLLGAAVGELAGRVATAYHARKSAYAFVPAVMDGGGGLTLTGRF
ncbi:MAG: phosphatase PAP2 family protein [Desulfuromonadales bacterium]